MKKQQQQKRFVYEFYGQRFLVTIIPFKHVIAERHGVKSKTTCRKGDMWNEKFALKLACLSVFEKLAWRNAKRHSSISLRCIEISQRLKKATHAHILRRFPSTGKSR